jgi:hypothetical protein
MRDGAAKQPRRAMRCGAAEPGTRRCIGDVGRRALPRHPAWRGMAALPRRPPWRGRLVLPRHRPRFKFGRGCILGVTKLKRGNAVLPRHARRRGSMRLPRQALWRGSAGWRWPSVAPKLPGLPRPWGWRGRPMLPRRRAWRGKPVASQKQKFLLVSVALSTRRTCRKSTELIHSSRSQYGDTSHAGNIVSYKVRTFKHSSAHKHHTKCLSSTS